MVNAGTFGAYTNGGPEEIGIAIGTQSDTYHNLKRTGEFVINIPSMDHAAALEACGRNCPHTESELDACGLTTEPATEIAAPLSLQRARPVAASSARSVFAPCVSVLRN